MGTLHIAVPFDSRWRLTVDGVSIEPRRAFGSTLAFDVPTAGSAHLFYDTPISRRLWVVLQALAWAAMLVAASTLRPLAILRRRTSARLLDSSPVADLTAPLPDLDGSRLPWASEPEESK